MPSPRTICLPIGSSAAAVIVTGPVATSCRSAQFEAAAVLQQHDVGLRRAADVGRGEVRDDLLARAVVLEVEARAVAPRQVLEEAPVGAALHQQLAVLVVEDGGVVDLDAGSGSPTGPRETTSLSVMFGQAATRSSASSSTAASIASTST